ncbi:MAG: hypothetical protein J5778_04010 [Clostridiales bacterium]|nr:hypothetical protein [Clostridiales bacterium]
MKYKKALALIVVLSTAAGFLSACNGPIQETSSTGSDDTQVTKETTATKETNGSEETSESTTQAPAPFEYTEFTARQVADEGEEGSTMVWGWNKEGVDLIAKYSDVGFKKQVSSGAAAYPGLLDRALASGENAPDLFFFGAENAKKYLNMEEVIPLNDLGIAYDEFMSQAFDFVVRSGTDRDGVIKGLSWQACPCCVIYNKEVAKEVLGVEDPEAVAPLFKDWDTFLDTARKVNTASKGEVKIISGTDDVWKFFLNDRSQGWVVGNELNIDPVMEEYINFAKILHDEKLTFNTTQGSSAWTKNMSNHKVLAYFGSMQTLKYSMGFADGSNKTSGEWGVVAAPASSYLGGTWIASTKYNDMKASSAQIIRDLCINETNLTDMTTTGEFVNNKKIMQSLASDPSFENEILGGQNPVPVLISSAEKLDLSTVQETDDPINSAWIASVVAYCEGRVDSIAAAEAAFKASVEDLDIF